MVIDALHHVGSRPYGPRVLGSDLLVESNRFSKIVSGFVAEAAEKRSKDGWRLIFRAQQLPPVHRMWSPPQDIPSDYWRLLGWLFLLQAVRPCSCIRRARPELGYRP